MLLHTATMLAGHDAAFDVLFTTARTQVATMTLRDGQESGRYGTDHPDADQTLYVIDGHCRAEIEGTVETLGPGDLIFVPAGAAHRFTGIGEPPCRTLNVYGPAAYPEA